MSGRRATSLVEVLFAAAIAVVLLAVGYQAMHMLVTGEKTTDRDSSRALAEALLMETLLQDLRSAKSVQGAGPGSTSYKIERYVSAGGKLEDRTVEVTWEVTAGPKVQRRVAGERPREFDFSKLINPGDPPFKFQLERVPDVVFQP